jgi:Family of unknown function (DUF6220)
MPGMKEAIYRIYQGLAWLIFGAGVLQFFLAGLDVFRAGGLGPHRTVGDLLILASLVLLILAAGLVFAGSLARMWFGLAAVLFALTLLQYFLASDLLQESARVVSALHPVNGLLLVVVSYTLARGRSLLGIEQSRTAQGEGVSQR